VKPIQIPEDLTGLSETELTELGSEIKDRVESLADEARNSDEALSQVEGLISDFDRINEELNSREQASADRSARLDAAMERFGDTDEESAEDTAVEGEGADVAIADEDTAEVSDEADEAVVASADGESTEELSAEESATDEASTEDATEAAAEDTVEAAAESESTQEASTEAPAEAATADESTTEFTAEVEAPEAEFEASTQDDESTEFTNDEEVTEVADDKTPNTVARLSERRPEAVKPESAVQRASAGLAARFTNGSTNDGDAIGVSDLAQAIVEKRLSMGNVPSGIFDKISVASATLNFGDDVVGGGAQENYNVFRRVSSQHGTVRQETTALVASGGVCAPLEPDYDFFRLAEEMNPVERCLPLVGAPRGGIRYIVPPDFRDAAGGVRVTTEAEDQDGYTTSNPPLAPPATNSTPPKPCVRVECPPIEECRVDAVSRCVTFGNLNYRVFPEQVEAFLADLSVIFTETKEIFYLDAIDANSTPVTAGPSPYGASRAAAYDLSVAAANYRRRHHMSPDATLQVMLPSWAIEFIKIDMLNDHSLGLSNWCLSDADVACWFAQNNLDVCFYYDSATGAGQAFNDIQAPGAINQWPDTMVSYMFAPGTFVRLDGGTLDVGLVRDSILNGTNDLQLFAEQWVQVCKIGLESLRIEHTLCPTGAATEPVPPLVCAAGVS